MLLTFLWLPSLASATYVWNSEVVSAPNHFRSTTQAILTDSSNKQHIFYGGSSLYHSFFNGTAWQKEVIDNSPRVGRGAVSVIDTNDKFHIIYQDEFNNTVKYATNLSGQWISQTLVLDQPSLGSDFQPAIAVDNNNAVHITYLTFPTFGVATLAYSTNKSGAWVNSILNSPKLDGLNPNMAISIDGNGNIHALCNTALTAGAGFNHDLIYVTNDSGNWVFQSLETSPSSDSYNHSSIKIDSTNNIHIAYLGNDLNLRHLTNSSGTWVSNIVDNGVGFESFPSLVIDNYSNLHISYMVEQAVQVGTVQTEVRYAENTAGSWAIYYNGVTNGASGATSLSLDINSTAHIAYFDVNSHTLNYLTNRTGWLSTLIDTSFDSATRYDGSLSHNAIGLNPDTVIDASGKVHSIFHQTPSAATSFAGPLIYSTNTSGVWVNTTIHSSGNQSRITIDSLGYVHIVFYSGNNLYYASNHSGSWVNQLIEYTLGEVDLVKPSIHIDGNGFAHIVYYSGDWILSSVNIRYANNVNGAWQAETIESLGKLVQWGGSDAPMFVSAINLDSLENPRVVYLNKNRDIALATRSTSGWSTSVVAVRPTSGLTWMDLSLTLSKQGKVHASYQRIECYAGCIEAGIGYASNESGTWFEEVVNDNVFITNSNSTGMINPAIVLDLNNQPHISYTHYNYRFFGSLMTQRTISHSWKLGSVWRTSLPIKQLQISNTPSSFKGYSTSIATTPNGVPSIVYYNSESESLDLATASKVNSPLINIFNTPNSSDFGTIELGQSSTRTVTIQNLGNLPLNITNISSVNVIGSSFTVELSSGTSACMSSSFTLSSNALCTFVVNYKASQLGSASTDITVFSNDPDLPLLTNTFSATATEKVTPNQPTGGCISIPSSTSPYFLLTLGFLAFLLRAYHRPQS